MKLIWGLLLLFSCSNEYGISKHKNAPNIVVDTAAEDTGTPPSPVDTPETADTGPELVPLIHIDPYDHDFGEVLANCSEEYDVTVSSVGTAPLTIEDLYYVNTPDLSMVFDEELPFTLEPGEETIISFEYNEDDLTADLGTLYIYSNALGKSEQKVTHGGQGVPFGTQVDTFSQGGESKTDILFVIDNSCSMSDEQEGLADNADLFVDNLLASGVDFQIAVITTDDTHVREGIIDNDTPSIYNTLKTAIVAGIGGNIFEKGQEMAMDALGPTGVLAASKGFQREDAFLSVIIVSDEDDMSELTDVEYFDFFSALKDPESFALHSVVDTVDPALATDGDCHAFFGERYVKQSAALGGASLNICEEDWGDFMAILAEASFNPNLFFPLSKEPYNSNVTVMVDGIVITTGWSYDAVSNTVEFEIEYAPGEDELVQIIYDYLEECDE